LKSNAGLAHHNSHHLLRLVRHLPDVDDLDAMGTSKLARLGLTLKGVAMSLTGTNDDGRLDKSIEEMVDREDPQDIILTCLTVLRYTMRNLPYDQKLKTKIAVERFIKDIYK
jgi:hypothetical protein